MGRTDEEDAAAGENPYSDAKVSAWSGPVGALLD